MKKTAQKYNLKLIESFFNPIIEKAKDFDYKHYTKYEKELNSELEKQVGKLDKFKRNTFVKGFKFLLNQVDLYKVLEKAKKFNENKKEELSQKDNRNKLFFELFNEADRIIPFISIAILVKTDLESILRKQCEPVDLFEDYENATGEHRARIAARIFREVSEMLYIKYIRILWQLNSIIKGKKVISSNESFGKMLSDLANNFNGERLELIESDAGKLRNALVHASYSYNDEKDSIIYWDKSLEKFEISIQSLYEKVGRMYEISAYNIIEIFVLQINNFVLVDSNLGVFFIENKEKVLEQDNKTLKLIETRLRKMFSKIYEIKFK